MLLNAYKLVTHFPKSAYSVLFAIKKAFQNVTASDKSMMKLILFCAKEKETKKNISLSLSQEIAVFVFVFEIFPNNIEILDRIKR